MSLIENLKTQGATLLFKLPVFIRRRLAGAPVRVDGLELDLDMQLILKLASMEPSPPLGKQSAQLDRSRRAMRNNACAVAGKKVVLETRDLTVGNAASSSPARLYTPEKGINALLLYFHGGGWAQGDLESHDDLCRNLASLSGAQVLAVDYRRSPEHPWPAAVDDAMDAYLDVIDRLAEFGISRAVIAVGGDSAGANLATVLARKIARLNLLQPAAQLLIYPATDSSREHPSKHLFEQGFLLTLHNIRIYERFYIPTEDARMNPDISPLLAQDLKGVAPAIVATAGFDPLRDEGLAYAESLERAGVPVNNLQYPSLIHGFANILCVDAARRAVAEMADALRVLLLARE